ncbi:hypothetical protein ACFQ7Z_24880 [Streptomyces virginiae]|uniref:hypothetical protein n=1 Tax=Streptomyces virginiae TaxID=1961 RepID=UPI00368CE928
MTTNFGLLGTAAGKWETVADELKKVETRYGDTVQKITNEFGDPDAPGLTQRLSFSAVAGGVRRDLVQSQVFVSVVDVGDPDKHALIRLVLTATAARFHSVLPYFQEFLRTVHTNPGEGN